MSATTAPTLDAVLASVSEFPERLGPVLIKELRQGLRSGLFVLPFVILPAVLALVALWALAIDNLVSARSGVRSCFWLAVIVPVLFITPLRALGSIRAEREAQTLDLLQLTPLTAWRIVLAKWSSLQVQAVLWVTALLPFFVLRYFFGAMNLTDELAVLAWVVISGAVLTAFGLVISTLPRLVFWLSLAGVVFLGILGLISLVGMAFGPRGFSHFTAFGSPGGSGALVAWVTTLLMAAHLTYLGLAFAASRIAPVADNYALRLRGGTIALFLWYALAALLLDGPQREARWAYFVVATAAATLFTTIDLTMSRTPLLAHVRPFARFGPAGVAIGRAFMPGWPGALVFFSAMTVLATGIALLDSNDGTEFAAAALIFWPAVVLPRAIQCFFLPRSGERPALHLVLHLAGPLVGAVIALFSFALGAGVLIPATIFPSALWWVAVYQTVNLEAQLVTVSIAGTFWTLGLGAIFFHHSRDYWSTMKRRAQAARQERSRPAVAQQ